jgi:RNA polymerase sigma factor (sigma-70 family)
MSDRAFPTTRWTLVMAAARDTTAGARPALAELCERYWAPLYAYARRDGHSVEEAQDLTQAFFARFLEKDYVAAADPARGRFRSFLLASFKHFMSNERDRERAQKRGGGRFHVSLEFESAEASYRLEPPDTLTPEGLFERRWAIELIDRVITQLAADRAKVGAGDEFERLKGLLVGERDDGKYSETAKVLGTTEGALRVTVHRLRRRFRDLLRAEIAATVADDSEIDREIRHLINAVTLRPASFTGL